MLRNQTSLPAATRLAAPILAFAAVLLALSIANGDSSSVTPGGGTTGSDDLPAAGDTPALISNLRDAAAENPSDPKIATGLGDTYYQRSRETGNPRFYDLADRAYRSALASDPANVSALSGQATIALARHQFADGLELARRAHRAEPALVAPYAAVVDGLIETGRYREAGRALDRMVSLKPTLAAYSRISYYRELHGDLPGAARALRAAISAGAANAEGSAYIRSLLGDLEASRGRYGAATQLYGEALAISPGHGRSLSGLAVLRAGRGELAGAISDLKDTLTSPRSPDALVMLGEFEEAASRLEPARRHYAQALAIEEDLLRDGAGYDAGVTLNAANHGDTDDAVRYGRLAWHRAPSVSSADAYSWALYRAGRIDGASRLSEEAMRLGSRNPEFLFHAGMIASADGRAAEAVRLLSALDAQSPRFNPLYAPEARAELRQLTSG